MNVDEYGYGYGYGNEYGYGYDNNNNMDIIAEPKWVILTLYPMILSVWSISTLCQKGRRISSINSLGLVNWTAWAESGTTITSSMLYWLNK